ncbi:MAG: chorismate synthase [Candidatus Sumerlaea sp.]|nr:chorismate synthase [Candidatus Sumerlaea chitinivorans]GIX45417.1 MAG: chorismate synthase [Candidatus Sumerlaea sp.]
MSRLDYMTAGESHGPQLTAIIRGIPSGLALTAEDINRDLARRQLGYGRGGRMKIEKDTVAIRSGVRKGYTLGSPITLVIENRDYQAWRDQMAPEPGELDNRKVVTRPRPGHADLVGALKFAHRDARNVLERASARETAARVAVGAVCKTLLANFGIQIYSHVVNLGGIAAEPKGLSHEEIAARAETSELRVAIPEVEAQMRQLIDQAKANGDTVGGVYEVVALGVPLGLGSTMNWDEKLDARLAGALMSCQAIKGVSIGMGFDVANHLGSRVHDPIAYTADRAEQERLARERGRGPSGGFYHLSNNAGGIEGGMSNGEPIVVRVAMKPIATLMKPLASVDLATKEPFEAVRERSDVCAVPAAAVVGEAIVAFVLAQAFLEKFGGDSMVEIRRNYDSYVEYLQAY